MVMESSIKMMAEMGMRPIIGGGYSGELEKELGLLLREQRRQEASDRERELCIYMSGSAPPSVEGLLAAVGGLLGRDNMSVDVMEEELRSDPAYLSYYYSHVNLNPRLPPPVLSKEDWRFTQRFQAGLGGIEDKRRTNRCEEHGNSSLFSLQQGFHTQNKEREVGHGKELSSREWLDRGVDGLIGLLGLALGQQKSFVDIFQGKQHRMVLIVKYCSATSESSHGGRVPKLLVSAPGRVGQRYRVWQPT